MHTYKVLPLGLTVVGVMGFLHIQYLYHLHLCIYPYIVMIQLTHPARLAH